MPFSGLTYCDVCGDSSSTGNPCHRCRISELERENERLQTERDRAEELLELYPSQAEIDKLHKEIMEPKEYYEKRLAEIENNPSYLCEKKLLKTQELVLEQAERIEELELRVRRQHAPGCLAARERRKNIKRWEPFTDCNCD